MPTTTQWERTCRRRDVIRLRYGKNLTTEEIANELGWSERTIERDLSRIRSETAKMGDPEQIREHVLTSIRHLIGHEYEDLHAANRGGDERAKHRAKTSFRQTLDLLKNLHEEISGEATPESIESLSPEAREALAEAAEHEVMGILRS